MPTLTVYPDAHPESATVDGYVNRSGVNETFATIRSGAGTLAVDDGASGVFAVVQASTTTNQFQKITRTFFLFDTSSIGSSAAISSAVLTLTGSGGSGALGGTNFIVVTCTPASATALATGDYGNIGTTSYGSISTSSWNTAGGNDITLGTGCITKAGITKLGGRLEWDQAGSFTGSWSSNAATNVNGYFADQTGTTSDPKLVVVYSTDVTASPAALDQIIEFLAPAYALAASPVTLDQVVELLAPAYALAASPVTLDQVVEFLAPSFTFTSHVVTSPAALDQIIEFLAPTYALAASPVTLDQVVELLAPAYALAASPVTLDQIVEFLAPAVGMDGEFYVSTVTTTSMLLSGGTSRLLVAEGVSGVS